MKRGMHPNSRANLKPTAPGDKLNPTGRPKGFRSVVEYLSDLSTCGKEELERVAKNPKTPAFKAVAARQLLRALDADRDGTEFQRVVDNDTGKPVQRVQLNGSLDTRSPTDRAADLLAQIASGLPPDA